MGAMGSILTPSTARAAASAARQNRDASSPAEYARTWPSLTEATSDAFFGYIPTILTRDPRPALLSAAAGRNVAAVMRYFTLGLRCKKLTTRCGVIRRRVAYALFYIQDLGPVPVLRDLLLDTVHFAYEGCNAWIGRHGDDGLAACVRQSDIRRQSAARLERRRTLDARAVARRERATHVDELDPFFRPAINLRLKDCLGKVRAVQ